MHFEDVSYLFRVRGISHESCIPITTFVASCCNSRGHHDQVSFQCSTQDSRTLNFDILLSHDCAHGNLVMQQERWQHNAAEVPWWQSKLHGCIPRLRKALLFDAFVVWDWGTTQTYAIFCILLMSPNLTHGSWIKPWVSLVEMKMSKSCHKELII